MSYRPAGPLNKGNFAKTGHSSGGLSLLKITGDTGDTGDDRVSYRSRVVAMVVR